MTINTGTINTGVINTAPERLTKRRLHAAGCDLRLFLDEVANVGDHGGLQ